MIHSKHAVTSLARILTVCLAAAAALVLPSCVTKPKVKPQPNQEAFHMYEWHGEVAAGPASIVIYLDQQKAFFYRGKKQVGWTYVATGKPSHPTPAGTYLAACVLTETILGKKPPSIPNKIVGHLIGANELPVTGKMVDLVSLPLERAEFLQRAAAEAVQSLIEGSVVSRTPTNPIRPGLPAGHKPMPNDLTGVWRGKILFYPWPATMELRLNAPGGDHCSGQWNVTSQSGEHKMTGPIDSCRVTETGVAFLVRDYRGITVSESYWAHFTGETLAGWVEFRGLNRSAHMSGSWELRKQR